MKSIRSSLFQIKRRVKHILEFYPFNRLPGNKSNVGLTNEPERHDWVKLKILGINPGKRILDAGAGEQRYRKWCTHLNYVSQDFCQYDGFGDGKGEHSGSWDTSMVDIVCDITNIPEPDNAFDAILCTEVLEHIPNPLDALKEFQRLLKIDGKLILTAPFCSLTHQSPYHFSTGFNKYFYEYYFANLGFIIDEIKTNGNYFEYIAQEIRRLPAIAKKYSNHSFRNKDNIAKNMILELLKSFSLNDSGSDELLCYGYHILARKKK